MLALSLCAKNVEINRDRSSTKSTDGICILQAEIYIWSSRVVSSLYKLWQQS